MGIVYEAYDRQRHGLIALKTLRLWDAHRLVRLKQEFRALADLDHRNLVRLGELICEDGQWFFTMDLVSGVDFLTYVRGQVSGERAVPSRADTALDAQPPLADSTPPLRWERGFDETRLRSTLGQLALGIAALHAAQKVHRDIKPSNILVTAEGRAVLLDFGLVTDLQESHHSTEMAVVGTAHYMAPEQAASRAVGPSADWYSVGVVLYEALAGQRPFLGDPIQVLLDKQHLEPPAPRTIAPDVPADLDDLCMDLLRKDPAERPGATKILARLGVTETTELRPSTSTQSMASVGAPGFVGRNEEREVLHSAFRESLQKGAVSVLLSGESGLGKSTLVRQFLDELKGGFPQVLTFSSRCYERESVPFKAFDGIVDAVSRYLGKIDPVDAALLLPRDIDLLTRLFPVLRWVPVVERSTSFAHKVQGSQELRARGFAALRQLLARLADHRPLVLFIDDLQWADADSLALLEEVMRAKKAPRLLLLATVRSAEIALPAVLEGVAGRMGDVRYLPLRGLSPEETCQLVSALLPEARERGWDVGSIAREAGGHPLFVQELVRHVARQGGAQAQVRLEDAMRERIKALSDQGQHLLHVVCVSGAPTPQAVVFDAAGLEPGEALRLVASLRVGNLVRTRGARGADGIEAYHDRIRETVIADLPDEAKRELHSRLANAIEASGEAGQDPRTLVRHLMAAGEAPRAATHAEGAAKRAAEQLAFDQAAELYGAALKLGEHAPADARRLTLALADALVNVGHGAEAAEAYLGAAVGAGPAARLDATRRAAEQFLMSGHLSRGLALLNAVLEEVGVALPRTPRRALLSLVWRRIRLRLRGCGWKEQDESALSAADLSSFEVHQGVANGLAMIDNIRAADFQARSLLIALDLGERRRVAQALAMEAVYRSSQGPRGRRRAHALTLEVNRIAERSQDPYARAYALMAAAGEAYCSGDFPSATANGEAGEKTLAEETMGTLWLQSTMRIVRLMSLRQMGLLRELRQAFDEYLRDAARRGDRYTETTLTRVFNLVWLVDDAPLEARQDLDRTPWTPPEEGYHFQHWYELRARVELDLYEGSGEGLYERYEDRFARLESSLLLRVQPVRTDALWSRARLLLASTASAASAKRSTRTRAVLSHVSRLAGRLHSEGVGYARVYAWLLGAAVAYRRGEVDKARAVLKIAVDLAEAHKLGLLASVAWRRLGELQGGEVGAAMIARAEEWMIIEGVRNSTRMAAVMAPGFEGPRDGP
jgi:serine/threonine protein kinase